MGTSRFVLCNRCVVLRRHRSLTATRGRSSQLRTEGDATTPRYRTRVGDLCAERKRLSLSTSRHPC